MTSARRSMGACTSMLSATMAPSDRPLSRPPLSGGTEPDSQAKPSCRLLAGDAREKGAL
jgi:hypothetical protein